jgi:chorismate mutase-like protein
VTPEQAAAELARHRESIDAIDLEILRLLNARTTVVERIGQVKRESSLPVYEPKREDAVFRNVMDHNPGPLPSEAVKRVFERIIDEMRTVQRDRMLREQSAAKD